MANNMRVGGRAPRSREMAISRSGEMSGGGVSGRISSRPIPKRGQVKVGIVVGLAHSVASIFSQSLRNRRAQFS
ncbi:hypothetical protein EUGRSUZ_E03373 [Eucalyptus grandis]|uniref:Uncharacterized protein n=2 Tax=Eucalyptus grandis TaxID=71139 RepID=A0ACC3KZ85_EUCGR|nr:hypothetical protein EUGRSUZ_E03373 [Eucalyptus grandis]